MKYRFKIPTKVFTRGAWPDIIPALGRLRQKGHMIGASRGYMLSSRLA